MTPLDPPAMLWRGLDGDGSRIAIVGDDAYLADASGEWMLARESRLALHVYKHAFDGMRQRAEKAEADAAHWRTVAEAMVKP